MNRKDRKSAQKTQKKNRLKAPGKSEILIQQRLSDAVNAFQSGDSTKAALLTDGLIQKLPPAADLFKLRGSIEFARHSYFEAAQYFKKGLDVDPKNGSLCELLGTSYLELGQYEDAIVSYRRALLNDGRNAGALNNLGLALLQKGDAKKAEKAFRDSLIYRPNDQPTTLNLAHALEAQEYFDDAVQIYRNLIREQPDFVGGYQALGECQMNTRDWQGALHTAEDAIARNFKDAEVYTLKGYALGALLKFAEAEQALQEALVLEPSRTSALNALGILSFYQEKWRDAWSYFEARQDLPSFKNRPFAQKRWSGEDVIGKKILVWGEQGVGDEILFGTMLRDFLKKSPHITFEMDSRLVPLFSRSFPDIDCVSRIDAPPDELLGDAFDYQVPSGSLGKFLRPNVESFGSGAAYLKPDIAKVDALRHAYRVNDNQLNVGISWYSSNGRGLSKSIALENLGPLFEVEGVRFFDLQYGDTLKERQAFSQSTGFHLFHDDSIDQMISLDDFAAQIAAMDLVISISNSTVHLSGALGIPTWIMLSAAPMERWLMDRSDSPWYASVELFRQRKEDDLLWVIETLRGRLAAFKT